MQRVRILFMGLLALFVFPSLTLSAYPGECAFVIYYYTCENCYSSLSRTIYTSHYYDMQSGVYIEGDTVNAPMGHYYNTISSKLIYYESGSFKFKAEKIASRTAISWIPPTSWIFLPNFDTTGLSGCPEQPSCDASDDDGDGVCNSCDKKPGQPDDDDCVWYSSTNDQGQTVDLIINEGCKQPTDGGTSDTLQHYRNDSAAPDGAKLTFDLAAIGQKFRPKTCDASTGADDQGQCNCAYPAGNPLLAGMSYQGPTNITPETQKDLDDLKDLDDDNKLDNCDGHNSRCQDSCAKRGGVFSSFCRVDQMTGNIVSQCKCNDESGYTLVSPSPDTSTPSQDSDGDGIPDEFDKDHTGGTDNNNDGIDDNRADSYEAFKRAIVDSGLKGSVDALQGSINNVNNTVSGLGTKIAGVGSDLENSIGDLKGAIDGIGDQLAEGITAEGTAALPNGNNYDDDLAVPEQQDFSERISDFISSAIPVVDIIKNSSATASGSPILSVQIYGSDVVIDMSEWEAELQAAGLVLVAIATILAFMIIL